MHYFNLNTYYIVDMIHARRADMNSLKIFTQQWPIKTVIGIMLAAFPPVWAVFIILILLILLDTITGIIQAIQLKRFNSRILRMAVKKIITYSVCILTTRLLEQGVDFFFQTTAITQTIIGFLIVTEAVSILENLTLMGVPLPKGLVDIILKNLKAVGLKTMIQESIDESHDLKEIDEIIYYQLPTFKNEDLKKLLQVMCDVWSRLIIFIRTDLDKNNMTSNDILYYKVMTYVEINMKEKEEKWKEDRIPEECIDSFNKCNEKRIASFFENIKNICYSEKNIEEKIRELVDRIMILAYQTIADAHKSEQETKGGCCLN